MLEVLFELYEIVVVLPVVAGVGLFSLVVDMVSAMLYLLDLSHRLSI